MRLAHLTASTLFGGPERQMLGLADALPPEFRTTFVAFREHGRGDKFLSVARDRGFDAVQLSHDTPRLLAAVRETADLLRDRQADALLCHGYKANLVGRAAARRAGIPVVAVSRGWTWASRKVRLYEALDRWHLKFFDRVVCVSESQAGRVRRAGVPAAKVSVIRNSARPDAFARPDPADRDRLLGYFPRDSGVSRVVLAAGRLSPEKGFDVLVAAAGRVLDADPGAGIVLFGDGPERAKLERFARPLGPRFVLAGFAHDLDPLLPWADVAVLPSFTEGLPNVVLEAGAAGVPVVATAVGGTPEAVADRDTGYLVPPGDPTTLADRIVSLLADPATRRRVGDAARERVQAHFTFAAQAAGYAALLESLVPAAVAVG